MQTYILGQNLTKIGLSIAAEIHPKSQFPVCCFLQISFSLQNFVETGWFFTEILQYTDFQNGGCTPSWIVKIVKFGDLFIVRV